MLKTLALLASLVPVAVRAQEAQCMDRNDAIVMMHTVYGESPIGEGELDGGGLVVIFANPITGSFTITRAEGALLCLVTFGTGWIITDPVPPGHPI